MVIVEGDGSIQFCNQPFETMLSQRLNVRQVPNTIYKLTSEDEDSNYRLRQLIMDIIKPAQNISMTMNNLKNSENSFYGQGEKPGNIGKRIEIKLGKNQVKQDENKKKFKESQKEESKNNTTISDRNNQQKDIFEKFEIVQICAESVSFHSKKAIMITFNIISEQKAKNRLIYQHSQLLFKFLSQFNKKLQQLNQRASNDEDVMNNSSIVEFLGNTYVAINQVQQIQHEFWSKSDVIKANEENFLLTDEVMQCVESLSVKCLNSSTTLKLDATRGLPDKLSGDLQKFRLALHAVSEFAMRYCVEGLIQISVNFESLIDQKYLISFEYIFCKNSQYNEEPLINLLTTLAKSNQSQVEDLMLKNFEDLFDLISQFGIGMLIFPTLIAHLDGTFSITSIESQESKEEEKIAAFEGEQDQAHPLSSNKGGKIKISFKLRFSQPQISKQVMSPYTPINKTKQLQGNTYILKSPNLVQRENREQALSQMRQKMQQNRSPMIGSNYAQNKGQQNINITNYKHQMGGCIGSNMMSDNMNSLLNHNVADGCENSFGHGSHQIGSNTLNNSNNKNRKNSQMITPNIDMNIVKRVDNKLKNLESRHPSQQNLFQNQNLGVHQNQLIDEKKQMEMTNSRKNSQQVLPSNFAIQQKAQELAPIDAHRIQSMNYIVHGLSNLVPQGSQHFHSNKSGEHTNNLNNLVHANSQGNNLSNALSQGTNSNNLSNQNSNNLSKEQKKKKPSLFIKIKGLDEESNDKSCRKQLQPQMPANQNDPLSAIMRTSSKQNIEQHNINQIQEQQRLQQEVDMNIIERDKEFDCFLLENQEPPALNNSRMSSKSFKVARTLKQPEQSNSSQLIMHQEPINGSSQNQDEFRKVLSFGQAISQRGQRAQIQNQQQNLQNFFIQNNVNSNWNNNGMINSKTNLGATDLNESTPVLRNNDKDLQNQSHIRFGEQSPIEAISDGAENFDSEDISEQDDTSEIIAQLSHNVDDQEEEKEIPTPNEQSYIKLDKSFDRISQNLSQNQGNKLQLGHRRKFSKTKRLATKSQKHEPLSQHIPKDILNTHHYGASKNLLSCSKDLNVSNIGDASAFLNQNGSPLHKLHIITPSGPKQPSLVYDDLPRSSMGNVEQPRYRDSYGYDETFCPYRRGERTLEYQHQLRKEDHARIGVTIDPLQMYQQQQQQQQNNTHNMVLPQNISIISAYNQNPNQTNNSVGLEPSTQSYKQYILNPLNYIRVWNDQIIADLKDEWDKITIQPTNPRGIINGSGQLPFGMGKTATYRDDTLKYVLIAEDNLMISTCLQEILKTMDYTPIVALNGKIAVEKFLSFMKDDLVFDLILMDIYMPEMNGYEATRAIRQLESDFGFQDNERHFICGFSAEKNDAVLKKCLESGMNDLYDKTMSKDILTDLLNKCQRPHKQGLEESHSQGIDKKDLTMLPGRMNQFNQAMSMNRAL